VKPRSLSPTEDALLTRLMDYSKLFQQETNETLLQGARDETPFNKVLIDHVEELVAIVLQPDCCGGMPEKW
jgi:hypothetical protein